MNRFIMLYMLVGIVIAVLQASAESFRDRDIKRLLKGKTREKSLLEFAILMALMWPFVLWHNSKSPSSRS
jgi:hypothetical protein